MLYRIIKWSLFAKKHGLNLSVFIKGLKLLSVNPTLDKNISIEQNFSYFRGYHLFNEVDLISLPICWRDVYGISLRLEHILDNNIEVSKDYLNLIYCIASCFLEYRGKFTNNHYLMNLLILERFSEYSDNKRYFKPSELEVAYNYVFEENFFLERSSHYLFIISLRLNKIQNEEFRSIFNKDLLDYYESIIPYYNCLTWLGDICPDKVQLSQLKRNPENSLIYLNFGSFIFFKTPSSVLKISLNDSMLRHGHEDYGSLVLYNDIFQLVDLGIDDLSNKKYKLKNLHSQYELGKFIKVKNENTHFNIYFSNCLIIFSSKGISFEWFENNIPKKIKIYYTGSTKHLKMNAKSSYSTKVTDKVVLASFKKSELSSLVIEKPKYLSIKK